MTNETWKMTGYDFKNSNIDKAIISVGSCETHGMHMPFGTDTFVAYKLSCEIADKVDIKIVTGWVLIPKYELPEDDQRIYDEAMELEKEAVGIKKLTSDEWYLRYLSFKWLNWRYGYNLSKTEIFDLVKKLDVPWNRIFYYLK